MQLAGRPRLRRLAEPTCAAQRGLAVLGVLLLASACSVYDGELLDDALGGSPGGSFGNGTLNRAGGGGSGPSVLGGGDGGGNLAVAGAGATIPNAGSSGSAHAGEPGGGSAGASGAVGGTGGQGGAPTGGPGDLIDDFEDQDDAIEPTDGRGGVWYLFDDATVGTIGPSPLVGVPVSGAPAELGLFALNVTASGFTGFGSGLGVDFRAGKQVYDASAFNGVRFWARVGAGKNTKHRLQISDNTTDTLGGLCNPDPTAPNLEKCEDHFGVYLTFTNDWKLYAITFAELTQVGWGFPAPAITASEVYGLQLTTKAKLSVDVWLDQIEFF